jgi:hypothetical protein
MFINSLSFGDKFHIFHSIASDVLKVYLPPFKTETTIENHHKITFRMPL